MRTRKRVAAQASFRNFLSRCIRKPKDKAEGLENDLDVEFLLQMLARQDYKCAISGIPLTHNHHDLQAVSVDRIDSTLGHVRTNIQLVCQFINTAKRTFTCNQMRAMLDLVLIHYPP